ncbi:hypothetical protein F7725_016249 [Dissostichus mawsoni]|uniref:VWFA domain-containing protein n=1 Tax=Dissostichus mawsoni TaxID=36200 RepID=A0A7J5Z1J4_DISMA|nr:hypothetical protein F7725_016249 [Dissostichus mawsoni]
MASSRWIPFSFLMSPHGTPGTPRACTGKSPPSVTSPSTRIEWGAQREEALRRAGPGGEGLVQQPLAVLPGLREEPDPEWIFSNSRFPVQVIERLNIGPNEDRVAVIQFSNVARANLFLKSFMKKEAVLTAVRRLSHKGGRPLKMGAALTYVKENVFTTASGSRSLHIGGPSNDSVDLPSASLKESNVTIFTIGTKYADPKEMEIKLLICLWSHGVLLSSVNGHHGDRSHGGTINVCSSSVNGHHGDRSHGGTINVCSSSVNGHHGVKVTEAPSMSAVLVLTDITGTKVTEAPSMSAVLVLTDITGTEVTEAPSMSAVLVLTDITGTEVTEAPSMSAVLVLTDITGTEVTEAPSMSAVLVLTDITGTEVTEAPLMSAVLVLTDIKGPKSRRHHQCLQF